MKQEIRGKNRNYPGINIVKIGQNTEKSPADLRWLVTQTPVKEHQQIIIMKLEIRGKIETILVPAFFRSARILRRVLETWGHSDSSERTSALADVKTSQEEEVSRFDKDFLKMYKIHQLFPSRGIILPHNECPWYDTKQFDGEVPLMQGTPSLPSLPGPHW